ncbi:MAG TPA: hypothetical protein P5013_04350 [Methanoregula sp.]|nr:hypothetical protein [Methanoregula sp.]
MRAEEFPLVRVYSHNALLAIGIPYPEFAGTDLLPDAYDLSHGATAVTTALAYKGHGIVPVFFHLVVRTG